MKYPNVYPAFNSFYNDGAGSSSVATFNRSEPTSKKASVKENKKGFIRKNSFPGPEAGFDELGSVDEQTQDSRPNRTHHYNPYTLFL